MSPRDPGGYRPGQHGALGVPAAMAAELYARDGVDWPVSGDQTAIDSRPDSAYGYRVSTNPATDTRGSRFTVTALQTGRRRTVAHDYSAPNPRAAAVAAVHGGPVVYIGEDARGAYYVGQ